MIRKNISLFPKGSYALDAASIYDVFGLLLELYLEIDNACAILEFDLLAGLVCDELIVLVHLLFLLLFLR